MGALLPVFFVLALGFLAGKRNSFDSDQAAGLSNLAVSFALPATLFVSISAIPRDCFCSRAGSPLSAKAKTPNVYTGFVLQRCMSCFASSNVTQWVT